MKRSLTLATLATLALAGMPCIAGAAVIVTANALHTGVHARVHLHRGHARHAHHVRAELSAARVRLHAARPVSVPVVPRSRPARSHSALPHATTKVHPSPSRGGTPYALGPASLSLGLWTGSDPMPVDRNELISNPSSGILRGRSPPRGDPPSATPSPSAARAHTFLRAPLDSFHPLIPQTTSRRARASWHADECPPYAARPDGFLDLPLPRSHNTPDRALEGGPAGSHLPSWRCFT